MAQKAKRRCPRCRRVVSGKCSCYADAYDQERGTAHERGYDGKWRRFRDWFLSRHWHCHDCGSVEALEVHHKAKVRDSRELMYDEANCMTLCQPCHARRTIRGE
jgi:5-methylcytosine-specific restriction enzyme A